VKRDFVTSRFIRLADGPTALADFCHCYDRLEALASEWISSEGSLLGETRFEAVADMRYAGQAFDLQVRLSPEDRRRPDVQTLEEAFHQVHEKIYSFRDPGSRVEVTTERLRVIGTIPPIDLPRLVNEGPTSPPGHRAIYLDGDYRQAKVYQRDHLRRDDVVHGPGIVEQEDTTTIILPGWSARIDHLGNIVITRGK